VRAEIEKRLLADAPGRTVEIRAVVDVKDQYFVGKNLLVDVLLGVIVLLVLVTGLGIVGVTSFSVTERTRQIGTRRALGAQREDVVRYFLVENWLVTTVGLTLGSVLAVALNVLLVEHGLSTRIDASLVLGGILALWTLGLLAALFPALRAAKVAPAVATRNV
jgi:putative ABC transport system permease protein